MKIITLNSQGIQKLYDRHLSLQKRNVEEKVARILDEIRLGGHRTSGIFSDYEVGIPWQRILAKRAPNFVNG